MSKCQLCGRRIRERVDGRLVVHHARGDLCPGSGHPPIERDDARLAEVVEAREREAERLGRRLADLRDRRANYVAPGLIEAERRAVRDALRLRRRLDRHRRWPDRFRREMDRQGWGDPPPRYLVERGD